MTRTLATPGAFFTGLRAVTGPLNQKQVDIVNAILLAACGWSIGWLAYALATAWHEARSTPHREWGLDKGKPYARPGKYGQGNMGAAWCS